MKHLAAFLLVNGAFAATSVVGAGVYIVLGNAVTAAWPQAPESPWPWLVIGIAAVVASCLFLTGAVHAVAWLTRRTRQGARYVPS